MNNPITKALSAVSANIPGYGKVSKSRRQSIRKSPMSKVKSPMSRRSTKRSTKRSKPVRRSSKMMKRSVRRSR